MNVSQQLGKWYNIYKRILPWREHPNPYHIWLSEIILQQTRMNQGLKYYLRFIEKFPTIQVLASSSVEDVLIQWQGLGYYARARNLHKAANCIVHDFKGQFPEDYNAIRQLPGVGEYTAAAIASLAFNMSYPAIDGNVYRVLARLFGIYTPIHSSMAKKDFYQAAMEIMDYTNPGKHNQSMIELGALICLPKKPNCKECPIAEACYAFQKKITDELPVRKKKQKLVDRYFYYLVIHKGNMLYIKQRGPDDIWAMLYDFPLIETKKVIPISQLFKNESWVNIFLDVTPKVKNFSGEYIHKLSHQVLHTWFLEIEIHTSPSIHALEISDQELDEYPFPELIRRYLKDRTHINYVL